MQQGHLQGIDTRQTRFRKLKSGQEPQGMAFIWSLVMQNNKPFRVRFLFAKMLR
jgi:hypothetical protein